jgi:phosphoglycerate dehydrogenase-like enzyme
MTEVLYLTEPDDPLVPKVRAAAKGRLRLTVEPGSFDLKNAASFDALLIGDVRLGSRIEKLAGPKLIQLTRGDHLDLDVLALSNSGVTVAGASPALAAFVAEHTLGLIAAITAKDGLRGLHSREEVARFAKKPGATKHLTGLKAGIVGFGRVGQAVTRLLRENGAMVVYADIRTAPHGKAATLGARRSTLDQLLSTSDVISLHVLCGPAANPLIRERELRLPGRDAVIVNTADGRLVDENALSAALSNNRIGAAALDVVASGAPQHGHPLLRSANVLATPYAAARSEEADSAVAAFVVANIERALSGGTPEGQIEVIGLPRSGDPAFWSSRMSPRE